MRTERLKSLVVIGVRLVFRIAITVISASCFKALHVSCMFGVFFPGTLSAHIFDLRAVEIPVIELQPTEPLHAVELNQTVKGAEGADRVSIHLNDQQGVDRGSLGEAKITKVETTS